MPKTTLTIEAGRLSLSSIKNFDSCACANNGAIALKLDIINPNTDSMGCKKLLSSFLAAITPPRPLNPGVRLAGVGSLLDLCRRQRLGRGG